MELLKFTVAALLLAVAPFASASTVEMQVNGLVCAFCAQGIEKTLRRFPETADVYVSLERRLVAVALKDGTDLTDAVLQKALVDSGYTVVEIRRTDNTLDALRKQAKADD
jgi:copper chaperone CopZ